MNTKSTGLGSVPKRLSKRDLLACSQDELDLLFSQADNPLTQLENRGSGYYEGRVLAGPIYPLNHKEGVAWMNSGWFPWKNKELMVNSDGRGVGRSYMEFPVLGRQISDFSVYEATSLLDGMPCLLGDFRSAIHTRDEIRCLHTELLLGRYYVQVMGEFRFLLYFVLELS